MDHHVFVHVALTHISNGAKSDLLERWHVRKPDIDPLLDLHELLHTLVLLVRDHFRLHRNEALLQELEELLGEVVELCTFVREVI